MYVSEINDFDLILMFPTVRRILCEVVREVRSRVTSLHAVAEAVAALDLLTCLTAAAARGGWVRPILSPQPGGDTSSEGNVLSITRGRHPILDLLATVPPVANDTVSGGKCRGQWWQMTWPVVANVAVSGGKCRGQWWQMSRSVVANVAVSGGK